MDYMSVTQAAALKGVHPEYLRSLLRDDASRRKYFPGTRRSGAGPRAPWQLLRADVLAWEPTGHGRPAGIEGVAEDAHGGQLKTYVLDQHTGTWHQHTMRGFNTLTPALAREIAQDVLGRDEGVEVWSEDRSYAYRLFGGEHKRHRKLYAED